MSSSLLFIFEHVLNHKIVGTFKAFQEVPKQIDVNASMPDPEVEKSNPGRVRVALELCSMFNIFLITVNLVS